VSRPVFRGEILDELYSWVCGDLPHRTMLTVITGHATMGKSALLDNLGGRVAASGAPVCRLTGIEDRRHIPYALIEQLTWPDGRLAVDPDCLAVARRYSDDAELLAEVAELVSTAVRELSTTAPLLITIDDVQHADEHSLACLRFVQHRAVDQRIKIICAHRDGVDNHPSPALSDYLLQADSGRIELDSLSVRQIKTAVPADMSAGSAAPSAEALRRASGGNPLLADLLLFGTRWAPSSDNGSAFGRTISRAALVCAHRMGPTAARLARGVAVLGDASDPRLLSTLCQVSLAVAERVVDHLHEVGLLVDGTYLHAEASAAIVRDIDSDELVRLRVRAARILGAEADPRRAADQLLLAGVVPDEPQVPLLREAAEGAMVANDLWRAAQYLDLARRCWPDHQQRHAISTELAYLHWMLDPGGSASRVNSLVPAAMAGVLEPEHTFLAAGMTFWHLEIDTLADMIDTMSAAGDNDEPLHVAQLLLTALSPGVVPQLRHEPPAVWQPDFWPQYLVAKVQALTSLKTVLSGLHDDSTRALAEQTLLTEFDSPLELTAIRCAMLALVYGEWLDAADYWSRRIASDDRWQSVVHLRASGHSLAALIALRRGELGDAVNRADHALAALSDHHNLTACLATATYIEACALLGEHREASKVCARPVPGQLFKTVPGLHYLHARATHQLGTGRSRVALTDFLATGEQMTRWGIDSPALAPWRLGAAQALLRLDKHEHAGQLLRQQLSAATGRYPWVERRTRLLIAEHHADLFPHQAEDTRTALGPVVPWLPETAPAAADRRHGDTAPPSARPASPTAAELSEAEQRVANLASRGLTNREIGEQLYLTVSTVEQHLTRIYRKLRIRNRNELPDQLAAPDGVVLLPDREPTGLARERGRTATRNR
jgi:DNA-binding CsgD family transcriptional regulator